jgi:hypothetical protein
MQYSCQNYTEVERLLGESTEGDSIKHYGWVQRLVRSNNTVDITLSGAVTRTDLEQAHDSFPIQNRTDSPDQHSISPV